MASRRGLKKAFRKHLGRVAKIGMVVLPIAGAIVAGPAGAAAGAASFFFGSSLGATTSFATTASSMRVIRGSASPMGTLRSSSG